MIIVIYRRSLSLNYYCYHYSRCYYYHYYRRFSMVTVPQGINRLLQTLSTIDPQIKSIGNTKKSKCSLMNSVSLRFKNSRLEDEFHKEMDHWFIPALAISIFFLVVYGIYHMLVMPRLLTSLALIIVALTLMFFILLTLYINYFHSFTQFITRTSHGHSLAILLIIAILFLCGIVNTFSCPQPEEADICQTIHFSAFSFAMWILTTAVFIRFSSIYLLAVLTFAIFIYTIQIFLTHPPIGPKEFTIEFDLWVGLSSLAALVFLHSRRCEKIMRLDFLSVVKGVEESASKDRFVLLNSQVLLNLVPPHVAPWVAAKTGEQWHHAHHSVGVAYLTISGFSLSDEQGLNGLNYVFTSFDQQLTNFRGIEKIKSANRFYIVAVGLLPDAAQNVNETPWTIGELLHTLAQFLLQATQFATEKEFQVQIGMDCGSALSLVTDTDQPRYELWGETVERARILMQSASHGRTLVSEEIFLALRPRNLHFSTKSIKVRHSHILGKDAKKDEFHILRLSRLWRTCFTYSKIGNSTDYDDSLADPAERLEAAAHRVDRMLQELNAYGEFTDIKPLEYRPFPTAFGSLKSVHRALSSACHTEYDNAESEAALSDVEMNANGRMSSRRRRHRSRRSEDVNVETECSSLSSSIELDPLRWNSAHSIGYENEYEMQSDNEGLAIDEMKVLSRDIRRHFGDFNLTTFDDMHPD
ncbi:unnamed protein product [Angiostrongylus costaricensis]|uniref:adenylate cyclase n=1 Tax=Angiostrongylus costaricensis TaxID=334426 RepID=A0A158PD32_ANGCS|nr:unnamed protein product [Angiostrongylus costaricensis]